MDADSSGEVIFTFDGDKAGQRAAEKAFGDDQKFVAQTFVAVEKSGMDPCELRMDKGDAAVRDLVAGRVPLVEFVLRETVGRHDLDTAEGRSAALDLGVPMVAQIKDRGLRDNYATRLAGLVGFSGSTDEEARVVARVRGLVRSGEKREPAPARPSSAEPEVDERVARVEREVLQVALQLPAVAGPEFDTLTPDAFQVDRYRRVSEAIVAAGGVTSGLVGPAWVAAVQEHRGRRAHPARHLGAGRRAAAFTSAHRRGVRRDHRGLDAVAGDAPSDRGAEGPRAADEPAGRPRRSRPRVRRADRARGLRPQPARTRDRRHLMALLSRLSRRERPPASVTDVFEDDERLLSWGDTEDSVVAATTFGLWWPFPDGLRRVPWQQVDKVVWRDNSLALTEADVVDDELLVDRRTVYVTITVPRDLPPTIRKRVEGNIVRTELLSVPGGAVRFVCRRLPGHDGTVWWARLEPGTRATDEVLGAISARLAILRAADVEKGR